MAWHLAPSLDRLLYEINERWPNRKKDSDGTIGDSAHQNTKSDHNPNSRGSVNALDIDKDGVDVNKLMDAYKQHPSTHYFIWNRKIYDRDNGFRAVDYTGDNPHTEHIHLSIRQTPSAEQDKTPWLEEEMDQATFTKYYFNAIRDEGVKTEEKARSWQYNGGGIPTGMSTLSVLNELILTVRKLDENVQKLMAVPPGTVVVDPEQLEAAIREVIGSVDEV